MPADACTARVMRSMRLCVLAATCAAAMPAHAQPTVAIVLQVVGGPTDPPLESFRPAVNPLFASAARIYGPRACGVLLTGMGRDGAAGLLALRDAGGYTLVQVQASSAVFGMARAAIEAGAVDRILSLEDIPGALVELVR